MSNSTSSSTSAGISSSSLLGVLFVGLKLTGYINWPWLWVLAPFWAPLAIAFALLAAAGLIWVVSSLIKL